MSPDELDRIDEAQQVREALRLAFHSLNPRGRALLVEAFKWYTPESAARLANKAPDWFSATIALGKYSGSAWGWIRAQIDEAVGETNAPDDIVKGVLDVVGSVPPESRDRLIAMATKMQAGGGNRETMITAITGHALKLVTSLIGGSSDSVGAAAPRLIE